MVLALTFMLVTLAAGPAGEAPSSEAEGIAPASPAPPVTRLRLSAELKGQVRVRDAAGRLLVSLERRTQTAAELELPPGEYRVEWGNGPALRLATLSLRAAVVELTSADFAPAPDATSTVAAEETKGARVELAVVQTVAGIALGGETCVAIECEGARAVVGALAVGGALGLGGSLYGSRDGVAAGEALAVNSGTAWGFWQAVALSSGFVPDASSAEMASWQIGGLLGGLGLGVGLAQASPPAGDVALANSAGIWSGALTMLGFAAVEADLDSDTLILWLLAASDAGAVGGAVASRYLEVSRPRTWLIDAGGLVGMLLGMGAVVLVQGSSFDPGPFFGAAMAGTVAGLGIATYATREWDAAELPATLTLWPVPGGAVLGVGGRL